MNDQMKSEKTFANSLHKASYAAVGEILHGVFGEQVRPGRYSPVYYVSSGSASARVAVLDGPDEHVTIDVLAWVVRQPRLEPELLRFLLAENESLRFGAFGLDRVGDVFLRSSIVTLFAQPERSVVRATVLGVLSDSDTYDDRIRSKWGGLRAVDDGRD